MNQKQLNPQQQQAEGKEFKARAPEYKNDGVGVWSEKDKNGKPYLRIKIVGHETILAFKYEPKAREA